MKPEPWRRHPVEQAHGSELVRRPSPGNQRRSRWPPRRQRQSRPPSDLIPIRVYPCPSVAPLYECRRVGENLRKNVAQATDGHGCTRILLSSYFVDTTLVLLCYKILSPLRMMTWPGIV